MSNLTPQLSLFTTEYAPWVAKHGLNAPYGKCQCGCGQDASIARSNDERFGSLKGHPYRFVRNHHTRLRPGQARWVETYGLLQPYGKCQCGCGADAPIATGNRRHQGINKGEPTRFIHAHGGRVQEHPSRPLNERFWECVVKCGDEDCWDWIGPFDKEGYALLHTHRWGNRAYRISYMLHYGPIPDGMMVCHHCDNRRCTRPDHLFLGTTQENTADMAAKRRHRFGERHNKAKLNETDIPRIRALRATGLSQQAIANQFGVSQTTISSILLGKTWFHVP